MDPAKSVFRKYWVPRDQIFYVRFLLEGYEGLVVQSSEPGSSVVTWEIPEGLLAEAEALARALEAEVGLVPIQHDPVAVDRDRDRDLDGDVDRNVDAHDEP